MPLARAWDALIAAQSCCCCSYGGFVRYKKISWLMSWSFLSFLIWILGETGFSSPQKDRRETEEWVFARFLRKASWNLYVNHTDWDAGVVRQVWVVNADKFRGIECLHFDYYVQQQRRNWYQNKSEPEHGTREDHVVSAREHSADSYQRPNVAKTENDQ